MALLVEVDLVVLAEEVLLQEERGQLLFATLLRKHELLKQLAETFIVDEVGTETQFAELAVRVGQDSVADCLESSDPDPVVAEVKELQSGIHLQCPAQCSSAIHIADVVVQVERRDRAVLLEGFSNLNDTRDTEPAAAQIEVLDAGVDRKSWSKDLGTLLSDWAKTQ